MTGMPSHVWANRFCTRMRDSDRHAQLCANSRFCTPPNFGSTHHQHRSSYDTLGFCGTIVEGRMGWLVGRRTDGIGRAKQDGDLFSPMIIESHNYPAFTEYKEPITCHYVVSRQRPLSFLRPNGGQQSSSPMVR